MTKDKKPSPDVSIYPTTVLEFEIEVVCVADESSSVLMLGQKHQLIYSAGNRVLVLTELKVAEVKHMLCLNAKAAEFDTSLVAFVNTVGRCAIVVDGCSGDFSPKAIAELLEKINALCSTGGGIDLISVLLPEHWKDEFLAASPVAQALAESKAEDLKYQAEIAAEKLKAEPVTISEPRAFHDMPITGADGPVTARVHLAGVVLQALIAANPKSINEDMLDKAVETADLMLLTLEMSRAAHGVES